MIDLQQHAALYLLGQLPPDELTLFAARLDGGDRACAEAAAEAAELLAGIALLAAPVAPPPSLRERLLERITPGVHAKRADEQGPWKPSGEPGVSYKKLYHDRTANLVTTLVKMEPGARWRSHRHKQAEQCLILEGDLHYSESKVYRAGDFTWADPGSVDPELYTVAGNLLLIISEP